MKYTKLTQQTIAILAMVSFMFIYFTTGPVVQAATVYSVKASGGDFTSISSCASAAQPGDICEVYSGTYSTVTVPNSGSSGQQITFRAHAGDTVTVGGFTLGGKSYVTVSGFILTGSVRCSYNTRCDSIKVLSNNFQNGGQISIAGDDLLISDNTFTGLSDDAIRTFGNQVTIRNNSGIGEVSGSGVHMDFWQSFCGPNWTASYTLIENNEWIDASGSNTHFALTNDTSSCGGETRNLIIRENKVRNIGSQAIYVNVDQAGDTGQDNVIYNNTIMDLVSGSPASWQTYCCEMTASANSSGKNNIFYDATYPTNTIGFNWATGGTQSNNLYYNSGATMTFKNPASTESGAIKNQNPLMTNPAGNDFSLQATSPAIDKGGALTNVASGDAGSGTTLKVDKAEFFQPGWGGANPDTLAVGSTSNTAQISSIDYSTNTITLASSVTRSVGDPIYLYKDSDGTQVLYGSAPDIGASEFVSGGGGSDTTPPTVSITSPANNSTVSGTIMVSATASDNVGVAGVTFKVDGTTIGTEDTSSPYSASLDTTTLTNTTHTLTAVARDTSNNTTTSSSISIIVPIKGDINLDHIVNSVDYSILNSDWFTSASRSDLNSDGLVNAIDYSILNSNWFKTW